MFADVDGVCGYGMGDCDMSYIRGCYELAEEVLDSKFPEEFTDKIAPKLAKHIQDTIENFLQDEDNFRQKDTREQHDTWEEHRGEV